MSLLDVQDWLLGEGLRPDLDQLMRRMVTVEIDNLSPNTDDQKDNFNWPRLLFAGSILARSETRDHQEVALRIASAAIMLSDSGAVKDAGSVLLDKLSNFRAVALASERKLLVADVPARFGFSLRIEAQRRQMEQAILVESTGRWVQANGFQRQLWNSANDHGWLSASAPTASGKTFLVLQWLIDRVRLGEARIAVYLAPTRALVSEIEGGLAAILGKDSGIEVSSLPLRQRYEFARSGGAGLILVLTQERLHLLGNIVSDLSGIDLLIVDEAHKIGDSQRGVILQDAIERVGRANPKIKLIFVSPATQNPGELLRDAPVGMPTKALDNDTPTVLQNLIVADQVPRKPKSWKLSVLQGDSALPVGVLELSNSPGTSKKKLAFIAAAAGERGGTLVYANGAAEAEQVADLISQIVSTMETVDSELLELADLARKGVHPNFGLVRLVERGVAFHYGNMPSLLRLEVERLFRSGKLRFLVCTSTLIEGVNLSCRTIVLRGPRKGKGHSMGAPDFWNLAGRAGRWGNEFQGNIICIDPGDANAWPTGVPARARYPIKRESDAVIGLGSNLAEYLDRRAAAATVDVDGIDQYEQVGAYLIATYLRLGSIVDTGLAKRHSPETIARLSQSLAAIAGQIEIDANLAVRHPGVSALGLQRLLEAFRRYEGDVENLLPAAADSADSYDRFVTIMRRINQNLFPAFKPDGFITVQALIVVQWLKGFSLAEMIRRSIKYHRENGREFKLPALIRQTMELVEQIARYRAPKYISAYVEVLHVHLRSIGREDLIDSGIDIATQLEFGVSSLTLVSLLELGLTRMSAVALYEKIARDDLSKEECLAWAAERAAEFDGMDIPAVILREVRAKLLPGTEAKNNAVES